MTEKVIWRDRVKEFRRVPASELRANPKNWREHPAEQRRALNGILEEVGIAGAVLARETEDGLELIDGHLRAEMDDATEWPVLILDVNEAEADVLLATIDPIGALASRNDAALTDLIDSIESQSENLTSLLRDMSEDLGQVEAEIVDFPSIPEGDRTPIQQMAFILHDEQVEIVKDAISKAKLDPFGDTGNENQNGNALARIAEMYLGPS